MRGLGGGTAGGAAAGKPGKQDGEEEGGGGWDRRGRSGGEKAGKRYGVEVARMAERGATCLQKQGQRLLPVTAPRLP
ncbi:hypothetical protein NDU88_001050 [Pleurodeles waltl]|uniref:Uncharacterized protein n=1 Tax=Pleurodeles waltl TaxID=8319 RepID=A0AAV7V7E9_PLEWA|nr:hypothetical protein NDU88_001050 [Pleurodeles waltl]